MAPLDKYHEKRDFERTPEPVGSEGKTAARTFVVQKHAASRLHYDFRLEIDGVLASWAVPKGPSLDPHDKRLAVHVEDHPIEYGSFEGTIPAGEYGGGTVMLWDRGTYEPESDMTAGLTRGDLKFTLHGEKLAGSWALVRMKPRPGEHAENWLLIKHRDEHARPAQEYDIALERPESAATGRSLDEIADGASRAGDDPLPFDAAFQLATLAATPPVGPDWVHEAKYDGYRLRLVCDSDAVRVLTRSGADWTDRFPTIAEAVRSLPVSSAMLDGEVVALRDDGVPDFGDLQAALSSGADGRLTYMAFDLLYLDGHDLRDRALLERKELLRSLLARENGPLRYVEHLTAPGGEFHQASCDVGLEGSVSKRGDRPYAPGRTRDWIKVKCRQRQEFVVLGWTEPKGTRQAFGALLLGVHDAAGLRYAGRVGSGFSGADLTALKTRLGALAVDTAPVPEPAELARVARHWVRPELVAEVAFQEWTHDGVIRQPSFVGLREDKPAGQVRAEIAIAGVTLTKPDKVLFEAQDGSPGLTKGGLAAYYERVADHIVASIARRPLTLVRCPHGVERDCFYQKHPDTRGLPPSLHTVEIDDRGTIRTYVWLDEIEGVIALAQLGVLEIHAWNSRVDKPDHPDRIVLDLDPGADVGWPRVRDTALLLRDALAALGLTSFVKTTGGRGLHVVVPIVPGRDFGAVLAWSRAFVEHVAAADPANLTAKMAKRLRPGRVFIDYLRNAHGATAVAAYSTRARPGAPVSVPLAWDELTDSLDPLGFDPTTVPPRLDRLAGTDPWEGYGEAVGRLDDALFTALGVPVQEPLADWPHD